VTEIEVVRELLKSIVSLRGAKEEYSKLYAAIKQREAEIKEAERVLAPLEEIRLLKKKRFEAEKKAVLKKIEISKIEKAKVKWEKALEKVPLTHRSVDFISRFLNDIEKRKAPLRLEMIQLKLEKERLEKAIPEIDRSIGELRKAIKEAKKRRTWAQILSVFAFITQPSLMGSPWGAGCFWKNKRSRRG